MSESEPAPKRSDVGGPDIELEAVPEVLLDLLIVEERIIDLGEEDERIRESHAALPLWLKAQASFSHCRHQPAV